MGMFVQFAYCVCLVLCALSSSRVFSVFRQPNLILLNDFFDLPRVPAPLNCVTTDSFV